MISSDEASYPYDKSKLTLVGQGIDLDLFSPNSVPIDHPPLLLSVGRISPIKDLVTLVEAIRLLRQRGHILRCTLVGNSPDRGNAYEDEVRKRVRASDLEGTVHFTGPVPNHCLTQWYRQCFAHVNCSPADHSLDKAVLEAMACAKPSLSSTLGFKETMGNWANGLLFQYGNPEDLARKIEGLLRFGAAEREEMGLSLRESVMKRHNLEHLADKVVALLSSLREETA
jgi:glycosyltransferase involved in cell wall biosynthesis